MFEVGKLYKHEKCLDTCIRVLDVALKDGEFILKASWHNFRYNMSYIATESLIITPEQRTRWKRYVNPEHFDCSKCFDTGSYMYDENHGTVCDKCCQHDEGWWMLEEHYGEDNGKWCCKAGCGTLLEEVK
jgi:hypothetical protein